MRLDTWRRHAWTTSDPASSPSSRSSRRSTALVGHRVSTTQTTSTCTLAIQQVRHSACLTLNVPAAKRCRYTSWRLLSPAERHVNSTGNVYWLSTQSDAVNWNNTLAIAVRDLHER